LIIAILLLIKL